VKQSNAQLACHKHIFNVKYRSIYYRSIYRGVEKKYLVPHKRQDPSMFYTYIIQSESTGKYYIGSTHNVELRIKRHNEGRSSYTRNRGPWQLKYTEAFKDLSSALKRENFIKRQKSKKYIQSLIAG